MTDKRFPTLRVEVSHADCMGVATCIQAAPRAFRLDENGQAVFQGPGTASLGELHEAAASCPMSAIKVITEDSA